METGKRLNPPCPVCGAAAGCSVAEDEPAYVRCRTIQSSLPIAGGGWLHVRDDPAGSGGDRRP